MTGSDQYQFGTSLAEEIKNKNNNNGMWVRSLYRIIKELDLEQFINKTSTANTTFSRSDDQTDLVPQGFR